MKIRLERDVLAEAVQWAARSLPVRPSVPILAGLLVQADADGVTFSSFDYETSAKIEVKAQVSDEGQALVSGRLLADISRSLPARPVEITADDTRMELVCGSARFTLQTLPVADYPSLPSMPEATGTVPSASFAQAVAQVVVAAGHVRTARRDVRTQVLRRQELPGPAQRVAQGGAVDRQHAFHHRAGAVGDAAVEGELDPAFPGSGIEQAPPQ